MDIFQAVILAVVEGITEFLPVSSTGHMIIASHLMHMPQTEFLKTFEIAIQLGAIAAVVFIYWRIFLLDWEVNLRLIVAFIPTAIVGGILYKFIKSHLLGNLTIVAWALFVGGAVLIVFELFRKPLGKEVNHLEGITWKQAMMIGLFQALSVVPGVSRSAATILGGLLAGVGRKTIVEFSFLLAVPTMMAATVLDLIKTKAVIRSQEWQILGVGFVVAFIVAWGALKFLLVYIRRYNFVPFGIYRIMAAVLLLWLLSKG